MRCAVSLFMLSLAACAGSSPSGPAPGIFAGAGRDRLCIARDGEAVRAGLIVYAAGGDRNCSVVGRLEVSGEQWILTPEGEQTCKLGLVLAGNTLTIAAVPARCGYYCGAGATLTGKSFNRNENASPAVDLAGDSLCP